MMVAPNGGCFYNYRNELYCGRTILRFGAVPLEFIFVILSFLVALLVLFPADREKGPSLFPKSFTPVQWAPISLSYVQTKYSL